MCTDALACLFRHLLDVFVESRCIDWCIIISMMLDDLTGLSQTIEKMILFKDLTTERLNELIEQLNALDFWAEQNW